MAFVICRRTDRDVQFARSASPLSVSTQRRDTVLTPSASMSLRKTGSQTPMQRHHWTSTRLACFTLSVSSTPSRTSSTKIFLPNYLRAVTVQLNILPHSSVLRRLKGLRIRLSGKIPPTPKDTELMPLHSSLARACQARYQKRFRVTARAPLPSLDGSSTTIQVLS